MKFVQPIRNLEKIQEIQSILRAQNERNYMMFVIGIYTGLRISDIVKLKVKDVRNKDHIVITEMKTKKVKRLLIVPELKRVLKRYIENKDDNDYLIQSRKGKNKPLQRNMAYRILKNAAKECGLAEIGTHTMRKTFGYHQYRKNKNVAFLMGLFNHSSQIITLRYIGIEQDDQDKCMHGFNYNS